MGLLDNLQKKTEDQQEEIQKREEDYISLFKVYIQGYMAANLGITNINMLPDLKQFKIALRVPTQEGKLGLGERAAARKLLMGTYGLSDGFFKELDKSISRNCKSQQQMQNYFLLFQSFLNNFISLLTTHLGWKLRVPKFFDGMIRTMLEQGIEEVMTKATWDSADAFKMCQSLRAAVEKLGYSRSWMLEMVFPFIMIAKGKDYVKK